MTPLARRASPVHSARVTAATRFNRRFVFVAGLHRCGTTLLADMLAAHPDISGIASPDAKMNEGQYLQSVYPVRGKWGAGAVGRLGFDPFAYYTEASKYASPESAERLFADWSRHWDLTRPVLLEKSPPNIIRTRFLQECFPDSVFILIARHPIAASIATKKWCKRNPVPGIMTNWAVCYARFLKDAARLKHHAIVRYEDLVRDPEQALAPLTDLIGVSRLEKAPAGIKDDLNAKYFDVWRALQKDPRERAMTLAVRPFLAPVFARFGYSFDDAP